MIRDLHANLEIVNDCHLMGGTVTVSNKKGELHVVKSCGEDNPQTILGRGFKQIFQVDDSTTPKIDRV